MPDSSHPDDQPFWRRARAEERWTVLCDFDGTIATVDVTDELLGAFALPPWQQLEQQWRDGEISARECMARQVDLLRVARSELYAHLARVHIDPGFREFVADCRSRELPLQIVSDGIDLAIRRVLARHGLRGLPVAANRLIATSRDTYTLEFPHARPGCTAASGTCKCAIAQACRPQRVLLIGDGRSDFCLAQRADFVFAKDKLARHCEQQGIAHRSFGDFSDVRFLLSELLDHPHHHQRPPAAVSTLLTTRSI